MIIYNTFFKKYVTFKKNHILAPRFFPLNEFELPRDSLLHYLPTDITDMGPAGDDLLIARYEDPIFIEHAPLIETKLGNPQKKPISLLKDIRQFVIRNRRFRPLRSFKATDNNKRNLIVESYGLCQKTVNYRPSMFSNYYRWYNLQWTCLKKATELQSSSIRNQFIYYQLPPALPTIQQLRISESRISTGLEDIAENSDLLRDIGVEHWGEDIAESVLTKVEMTIGSLEAYIGGEETTINSHVLASLVDNVSFGKAQLVNIGFEDIDNTNYLLHAALEELKAFTSKVMSFYPNLTLSALNAFKTPNDYWFLDFWMWLGSHREASVFSMLDHTPELLKKIHLVIGNVGAYTILNLGIIDQWREELKGKNDTEIKQNSLETYRKHILRMMVRLFNVKTAGNIVPVVGEDELDYVNEKDAVEEIIQDQEEEESRNLLSASVKDTESSVKEVITDKLKDAKSDDIIETDVIEQSRTFADEISDDEFNIDREARKVRITTPASEILPEDGIMAAADNLADLGQLSAAEYKRFKRLSTMYKSIPNPAGKGKLSDLMVIDNNTLHDMGSLTMPDDVTITNKGMLKSSLAGFDKTYINEVMQSDIANAVMHVQKAGVAVLDYKIETHEDALSKYDVYSIQVQPVGGAVSTKRFRLPRVEPDGTFTINGTKSRLRKQRADLPIRKVSPFRVAMTSYYGLGKLFVDRSVKSVYDLGKWYDKKIKAASVTNPPIVTDLKLGRVFKHETKVPHNFALIAQRFKSFIVGDYHFNFDISEMQKTLPEKDYSRYMDQSLYICGYKRNTPLLMDMNGMIYSSNNSLLAEEGDLESIIGLSRDSAPTEMVEMKISGKYIPMGIILSYYYGFSEMLEKLKMNVRTVNRGERLNLAPDERSIAFADEYVIFNRSDRQTSLILNGFNAYQRELVKYSRYDFDRRSIYVNLLSAVGLSARWIRELDAMATMWVDGITKQLLEDMGAPTVFDELLLYAVNLLMTDEHLKETDLRGQRVRGYERFAGAVYRELIKSTKQYNAKVTTAKTVFELHPDAVWNSVTKDTAGAIVEEATPIHNLREQEVVTYGGEGGRTARSMVKRTREYLPSYIGTISEATQDNADVGFTSFLSADPKFTSLRGISQQATDDTNTTQIMSTVAQLMPAVDLDSQQRISFASIQQSQAMYADNYEPQPYRTGMETVIAHRTSDTFSFVAKQNAEVTEVDKDHIKIRYEDGTEEAVQLGARYGAASGTLYDQQMITDLKPKDKVKSGTVVAWNKNYFQRDVLNPEQVTYLSGVMIMTALRDLPFTFEDSSIISKSTANKLHTRVVKAKNIIVNFDQEVRNLVSVGDELSQDSILCSLEDPITANAGLFDQSSYDALQMLAPKRLRAKVDGEVTKIEVFYKGDIDQMSESLAVITNLSNRRMAKLNKALGKSEVSNGEIVTNLRVDGNTIENNQAVIKVYIKVPNPIGVGDKGVFANQMKSTFGYVMNDDTQTEDGIKIDSIFSYQSIANRMVTSAQVTGFTNLLLWKISKEVKEMAKDIVGIK